MDLVEECVLHAELTEPNLNVGAGPYGSRLVATVTGGWVKGDRINGTLVGAGADWLLIGPDGWGRLDVRAQIQTDDGAVIYAQYGGLLELNEATMGAMATGGATGFDDQYFRTTPILETGDERYAWVNTTLFVGEGRLHENGVEYRLHRVT
ncbi:MAG TPA: DUF3237 domain-containing protein [Ilumatobacteraceae bacterium]|nr:DUF3237 domain-containing protein [Ilumatobacteraceae bacterium]